MSELPPEPGDGDGLDPETVDRDTLHPDTVGESRRSPAKVIVVVIGLVLFAFVALLATRDIATNGANFDVVGEAAPIIRGVSYEGTSYDLDATLQANRSLPAAEQTWTVVNFFASWCTGCIDEHPDLTAFSNRTGPCNTELIGVAINDRASDVEDFFDRLGGGWPVVIGSEADQAVIDYGATAPPETVLISPNGIVVEKWIGAVELADLEAVFEQVTC